MADNQVALSRMSRATQSSLSKATRQNVPPFLQKLYEMVSDSATDNLIRWSENGDSFFVLDHERFAHDVLPRWFKHSNFASFVRQLNMYGFHKIPHLQQGVLKSESETEIWNFEHPNFRRGQPDLLCLITRKKQAQERQNEDQSLGDRDGNAPGLVGSFATGSLVDVNSIINGIAAIKRHQATISADLNDLKASNQHLWQEALDARERHQKQQDTINRILKFLAGVFGSSAAHKGSPVHGSPHAGIPRKRQRLMIEGAAQSAKDEPLEPLDGDEPMVETTDESTPTDRFVEMSPSPVPSKAPSVVPETPKTHNLAPQYQSEPPIAADIVMGGNFTHQQPFIPFSTTTFSPPNDNSAVAAPYVHPTESITPTALTASSPSPREELLQSIVNSPGAMQRLLNLISFQQQQQNIPMPPPLDLNDPKSDTTNYIDNAFNDHYTPQPYHPPHSSDPALSVPDSFDIVEPDSQTMSLLHSDDIPGGISLEPYIENTNRLKETSDASSAIAEHVNMMDSNIDSLMKHLGLDPQQLDSIQDDGFGIDGAGGEEDNEMLFNNDQIERRTNSPNSSTTGVNTNASRTDSPVIPPHSTTPTSAAGITANATTNPTVLPFQPTVPDFDFNVFLNELAKQNGETPNGPGFGDYKASDHTLDALMGASNTLNSTSSTTSPQLSAFVDEIASQSGQSDISASPPRTRAGRTTSIVSDGLDSPITVASSLPDVSGVGNKKGGTTGTSARKRKPEVDGDIDLPTTTTTTTIGATNTTRTQTKTKRKR